MPRACFVSVVALVLAGCGARSALELRDAARPVDAGVDAAPCIPADPPDERCNARDDDCDGRVDETLPYGPIAPAHALRTTEGDTGAEPLCSSCRWAWEPSIVTTRTGMLVPFRLGIYGGSEQPSLFVRATDADGVELATVRNEGTSVPLHLRRTDMLGPDGATWIDASLRIGSSDLPGWLVVDEDGDVRVIELRERGVGCPSITLGDALMSAWSRDTEVHVDRHLVRAGGVDTSSRAVVVPGIEAGGLTSLGLAPTPGRDGAVLFVARFVSEPRAFTMWAQRVDRDGEPTGAAFLLLDEGAPLTFFVATTDDGYLLFEPGNGSPATSRFVDAALTHVSDAVVLDPGTIGSWLDFDFLRMTEGGWLVHTGDALVRLDARGRPEARWSGPLAPGEDGPVVTPDLGRRDGRTFIAWHDVAGDRTPNTVWMRELGCAMPVP